MAQATVEEMVNPAYSFETMNSVEDLRPAYQEAGKEKVVTGLRSNSTMKSAFKTLGEALLVGTDEEDMPNGSGKDGLALAIEEALKEEERQIEEEAKQTV